MICNQLKVNGLDSLDVTFSYCARGEEEEVGLFASLLNFSTKSLISGFAKVSFCFNIGQHIHQQNKFWLG